ncbi:MAG: M20 family metallopeptidase [Myxococcota bacterium]|nr:M20 family metallopeptidase [Myxococcota bacterium]
MDARDVKKLKEEVCAAVDAMRDELLRISHQIHAHPELAFEEHAAAELLVSALGNAGLEVEAGAYGLPTAFAAEFGSEGAPCVALLAEYDALPGIGHACGHNLIATSGVGAGLALHALGASLPGRVRVLGTPAEEHGCGKELMAREGALDGVDAALMMHPAGVNLESMPCIAMAELEIVYHGESAHAAAMPERGRNALDAMMLGYQAVAALRQHITRDERVHGIITDGGQAPNVVPDRTAGRFYVRSVDFEQLEPLKRRVEACFRAGAEATGCEVEVNWGTADYRDILFNAPLADAFRANAEALGREFFPWDKLPPSVQGSTDMGNVSYRVPSIHPMLQASPLHVTIHNPEFAKYAGAETGDAAALDGAKALAMTALDYFTDADLRERARAIFEAGGVA